jgi:multiple sugar transport system substrate-binding protein
MRHPVTTVRDVGTRRQFLALLSGSVAMVALAACGGGTVAATQGTATAATATATAARSSAGAATTTPAATGSAASTAAATSPRVTSATSSAPAQATVAPPSAKGALRWVFGDMDAGRAKLLDNVATQFNAAHPDTPVQADFISANYGTLLPTWAAGGTLYDVFFNHTQEVAPEAVKGMMVPLDPFIARDHLSLAQFNGVEMTNCTWQGKVYALPFDWSINAVYFNKDMFKAANVPLPPEDGNWTWDDLLAAAQHFAKSENGKQVQWGFDGLPTLPAVYGVLEANGGKIVSDDLKQLLVNNPENVATLEYFRDLVRKWHVAPGPGDLPKGVANGFAENMTAMQMQGSWNVESMRTEIGTRFDWDIAPVPRGSTGKVATPGWGAAWSMGVSTKQQDKAWELLSYVSSSQAEALSLGSGSPPGNVDAYPAYLKAMVQGTQPPQHVGTLVDTVKAGVFAVPDLPYYDQALPILQKAVADIYAGKEAVGTLAQAQQQINAIIPQYQF